MKKIYFSMIALVAGFSAIAQNAPVKQINDAKYAERGETVTTSTRGGGLSCPVSETFDAAFPAAWTNEMTNANENWVWDAAGGNGDGGMTIQYDAALGQQDESMITAAIDLSAIPNPGLYFDWFASYFWAVSPNDNYDLTVSISTDGTAYTDLWSEEDAGEFDSFSWDTKVLDLSAYASETTVYIKINYNGMDGAQASIDNISICSLPANDLRMDFVYTGDVENDYIYTKIPLTQAVEIIAGGIVTNFGVAAQTNVVYTWDVSLDGTSVASGTEAGPASLAAGEVDSVFISTGYTPDALGDVEITISVAADEAEEVPADNEMMNGFAVTEYVWAHDYEDEDYFLFGYETTDDDAAGGFEFGAQYFCQVDGDMIYALQFPLSSTTTSQSVIVKVYEDAQTNGSVSETVYDIAAGDLSAGAVNFITVVLDDPVSMTSGSVYTATVAIDAGENGFILGNNIDDNDAGQAVYFVDVDTWFNWVGLTTAMRLNLDATIDVEENNDVSGVYVFPNPANDVVNLGFVSKEDQNLTANIIAVDGTLVHTQSIVGKAGQSNSVRFNTENLTAGIYMIQLVGAKSTLTQRVIVQ